MMIYPLAAMLIVMQRCFVFTDAFSPSLSTGKVSRFNDARSNSHHAIANKESESLFDACWEADTQSVNPLDDEGINAILQRVCSPAPQSYYVIQKATANFIESETSEIISEISDTLCQLQYLVKPGYQWIVSEDDESDFQIMPIEEELPTGFRSVAPLLKSSQTTLEMAHAALDIASLGSNAGDMHELVEKAKNRLHLTLGTDLRGRLSADAAFSFAMAGVKDVKLYDMLATVACNEFRRLGKRPSFRSKYILQMVEKLAASGLLGIDAYRVAADCLQFKGEHLDVVNMLLSEEANFDLLSTRPLLWLWRFSSRQSKVVPGDSSVFDSTWIDSLADSKKPLVVDIGCGMGVSLLGLATPFGDDKFANSPEGHLLDYSGWKDSNLVGCDLVEVTVGYAQGIATRWGLNERLQYEYHSAQDFMEEIESSYAGNVALVMIQFPSPYRLAEKATGNTQLSSVDDGFMVSQELLNAVARVLEKSGGFLLLQSNVEDVAVTMRELAQDAGFQSVVVPQPRYLEDFDQFHLPQRTLEWAEVGGERAVGDNWSAVPLLPSRGSTETEVACDYQGTPVHRCLFRVDPTPGT
jgi:tRNA G46 methylase TrmB